jgi:hypothetical protein
MLLIVISALGLGLAAQEVRREAELDHEAAVHLSQRLRVTSNCTYPCEFAATPPSMLNCTV